MRALHAILKLRCRDLERLDYKILELRILAQLASARLFLGLRLVITPDFVSDSGRVHRIFVVLEQRVLFLVKAWQILAVRDLCEDVALFVAVSALSFLRRD